MGPNHWARSGPWKLITINKAAEVQTLADVMGKPLPDGTQLGQISVVTLDVPNSRKLGQNMWIGEAIGGDSPDRWLTIAFTTDREWAE